MSRDRLSHLVLLELYFVQLTCFHKSCSHTESRIAVTGIAAIAVSKFLLGNAFLMGCGVIA